MPTFKAPIYSKVTNQKGQIEPSYSFAIQFEANEARISFVADEAISIDALQKCIEENKQWWNAFLSQFLTVSAKLFSKPYTVDYITKIVKHVLSKHEHIELPVNVTALPTSIQIKGGAFFVHWDYKCEPLVIDIPDFDSDDHNSASSATSADEVKELDIDDVPMDKNTTEETLELENSAMLFDKQKVKEARLKAKLAMYKAQHQLERFYERYGTDITDSESESESESED
jgi:hypothetical protein